MKRLTLVRHAKSSWAEISLPDHDRILAERGIRDAPRMGKRIHARKLRPSLIISSAAVRAMRTAVYLAEALKYPKEFLQSEERLYLASAQQILDIVCSQEDNFSDLMVVGHNPGMTDLVNQLLPGMKLPNLSTCGVVAMDFDTDAWADLASSKASLVFYDFPKNPELLLIED
ncbi:MAG TPA: histidine phosphatase family protein [Gammaproteobacteria bacterium]